MPDAPPPRAMPEAGAARPPAPPAATGGAPDARPPLDIPVTHASAIPAPAAISAATPRAARAAPTLRADGREGLVARPSSHGTTTAPTRPVLRQRSNSRRPVEPSPAREAPEAPQTAFAQGPAETPAIHGSAERLAAASGGTLMREPTGEATVVFPDRTGAASPVPAAAATRRGAPEPHATEPAAVPAVPGRARGTASVEAERGREGWREDLYDYVLERLRRDLLHERERNGHLVDDLF